MKLLVFVLILLSTLAFAAPHLHLERDYQKVWCDKAGGITEVVLDDLARVDCLTDEYAVEFDFGQKWAESIGQALYYGLKTGKKSGVVLILEKNSDTKYLDRLKAVAEKHSIKVWVIKHEDLK